MNQELPETEAVLLFDSWLDDGPALRAVNDEDRHLIYEGGGIILDLLLKHAHDGACLQVGEQVLPGGPAPTEVAALRVSMEHGKQRTLTYTNAMGEFAFQTLSNGRFDLSITLRNRRFRIRGLSNNDPKMWRVEPSLATGDD